MSLETHSLPIASPQKTKTQHEPRCWKCTNSRHVTSDGCAQDVQWMYVYSTRKHVQYHHERGPSTFKSSSLVVCIVLIPAARRFFEDINRVSKVTLQRCPFIRKEANGSVSVRLSPCCAPLCTQKNLADEVSNPSFEARHSMSTRRSLPLGVITVCCILSYKPLLSVTHASSTNRVNLP